MEYYALAPGRTIALDARISRSNQSVGTSIPASGTQGLQVDLLSWISDTSARDGLYLVRVFGSIIPFDSAGFLQVTDTRLFLSDPTGPGFDIGVPLATFSSPRGNLVAMQERDYFVSTKDMLDANQIAAPAPLRLSFAATFHNNDGAAAHTVAVKVLGIAHIVRGILV